MTSSRILDLFKEDFRGIDNVGNGQWVINPKPIEGWEYVVTDGTTEIVFGKETAWSQDTARKQAIQEAKKRNKSKESEDG